MPQISLSFSERRSHRVLREVARPGGGKYVSYNLHGIVFPLINAALLNIPRAGLPSAVYSILGNPPTVYNPTFRKIFPGRETRAENTRATVSREYSFYCEKMESESRWKNKERSHASAKKAFRVRIPIVISRGKFRTHTN